MRKNITIIYFAVFILILYQFTIGCDDKNSPPQRAVAVSKKIVQKKSDPSPSQVQTTTTIDEGEIAVAKAEQSNNSGSEANDKKDKQILSDQINKNTAEKPDELPPKEVDIGISVNKMKETVVSPSISKDELAKLQPEGVTTYNPEGKIDPFEPLFKEGASLERGKKLRTPRTPLEMVELSQLKLVAIMRMSSGKNRALVEEASGKGYIVEKGTYIGNNSGRIVKILIDRIIIEEEIENIIGDKKIQERELKLQKPLGEE